MVARKLPESCKKVARKLPESCQKVERKLPESHETVMRRSWDSLEKVYYSTSVAGFADISVLVCSVRWSVSQSVSQSPFNRCGNMTRQRPDMENVPSKPSAAQAFFFSLGKFLVLTYAVFFLLRIAKIFSSMLYQAVGVEIILGWVIFPGYVTLPSTGNFTQTDVVYPAWIWVLSLCNFSQPG